MVPIRRALLHIERLLIAGGRPTTCDQCGFCGTKTIRDSQFAHESDCAALVAEMFLLDAREALADEMCVTSIPPGMPATITDEFGTHCVSFKGEGH